MGGFFYALKPFAIFIVSDISGSSEQREMGKRYMEKAERYKIGIAPAINLREPDGGLLLHVGF